MNTAGKKARKKILVIDDMPKIAAMVKARLEASGYDVIAVSDGQQGLAYAFAEKPDLILLDIVMPAGGGYTVYTRLRRSPKTRTVPVIFLTAKDRPEDLARAYKLGVQYYVKKPYKPEMLLEAVEKVLEASSPPELSRGLRKRILAIMREPEVAESVKLRDMGYDVAIASNIQEGAGEAKKEKPDVILLDGGLVQAKGYGRFNQLWMRFSLPEIPTILCVTQDELKEFQEKLGDSVRYCVKPFSYIDLLGDIRVALQQN